MEGLGLFCCQMDYRYLIYDYPHIFKNLRNNWITEAQKHLIFMVDGKEYLACWSDIVNLYEEDRKEPIRATKLTHTSVYPKPLQRQSVPLVYQVFNEKTYAALLALTTKLKPQQGTAIFLKMISDCFKMMSVKDKYKCIRQNDDLRVPWPLNCESFIHLNKACDIVASCEWQGGSSRQRKLTKFTASAFVVTTKNAIFASNYLLEILTSNIFYLLCFPLTLWKCFLAKVVNV